MALEICAQIVTQFLRKHLLKQDIVHNSRQRNNHIIRASGKINHEKATGT